MQLVMKCALSKTRRAMGCGDVGIAEKHYSHAAPRRDDGFNSHHFITELN